MQTAHIAQFFFTKYCFYNMLYRANRKLSFKTSQYSFELTTLFGLTVCG